MALLAVKNLTRYAEIAKLLMKYGRSDIVLDFGIDTPELNTKVSRDKSHSPHELSKDLQELGPLFVKLGQLLSTQSDILPPEYEEELTKLQDKAAITFSFSQVEEIFLSEFGVDIHKAFSEIDPEPIAAASLSQVYKARLRDGRKVALKVQRPGIQEQILDDLKIIEEMVLFIHNHTSWEKKYRLIEKFEDMKKTLMNELNFEKEAHNLDLLRENLKEFKNIVIPKPIPSFTSEKIITMEFIEGTNIATLSPVVKLDMNTKGLTKELFKSYLKQILIDGVWHMDPHLGNVYLTPEGNLAVMDLGMVAYIPPDMQKNLLKMIIAIGQGRGDTVAEMVDRIGFKGEDYEFRNLQDKVSKLVAEYRGAKLSEMVFGKVLMNIARISSACDITLPTQFGALGKTLINLDQVGKALDPNFNPTAAIKQNSEEFLERYMSRETETDSFYHTLLETTELAKQFPSKLMTFLDQLSHNEFQIKVNAIDEHHLMEGFQKIANRISIGLVLAAMIIGGALLMRVETEFKIWGYPGLAMILFLTSFIGAVFLIIYAFINDEISKKK